MYREKRLGDGRDASYPDEFRQPRSQDEIWAGLEERARVRAELGREPEMFAVSAGFVAASGTVEVVMPVEELDVPTPLFEETLASLAGPSIAERFAS